VTVVTVHSKPIVVNSEYGEEVVVGAMTPNHWGYTMSGMPYQIIEIQLPFVVLYCQAARTLFSLDKRLCEFLLMSESYVKVYTSAQTTPRTLVPAALPKNVFLRKANETEWCDEETWKNPTWLCRSCGLPVPSKQGEVPNPVCGRCAGESLTIRNGEIETEHNGEQGNDV